MLTLASVGDERAVVRRVEEYFPLQLDFSQAPLSMDALFYWQCTGKGQSLEITIAASTGIVAGIEVIRVPVQRSRVTTSLPLPTARVTVHGAPAFEIEPWRRKIGPREFGIGPSLRRVDEELAYSVEVSESTVSVSWDLGDEDTSVVNGDVRFGFTNSGSLTRIAVFNLGALETQMFRAAAHLP